MLLKEKGLTLIELLIAISISFIVVAGTMQVLITFLRLRGEVIATGEVNQNARIALNSLENDARIAIDLQTAVGDCASPCTLIFKNRGWISANGTNCVSSANITCFGLDNTNPAHGVFWRRASGSAQEAVTSANVHVQSFSAKVLQNGTKKSIQVTLTMQFTGPEQSKFTRTVIDSYELR